MNDTQKPPASWIILAAVLIVLSGCDGAKQSFRTAELRVLRPDVAAQQDCFSRPAPWAWDRINLRCVQLTPQQQAEKHDAEVAAWNASVARGAAWTAAHPMLSADIATVSRLYPGPQEYSGQFMELAIKLFPEDANR